MSKEEAKGKAEKVKGKVREEVGEATGNEKEQMKGKMEQGEGEARDKLGNAKRKTDEDE